MGLECWGVGAPGYWIDEDGMLRVGVQRVELLGVGCGPVGVLRACELECWSGSSAGGSTVGRCAKVGVLSEVDSVGVRALWVGVRRGGGVTMTMNMI